MVFLIFTRSNLYLGINGRITELLPFGDQPYLSLKNYHFPSDLDNLFRQIRVEVESYYDRTAFGVPSNLNVLAVYSGAIANEVKREITNEFAEYLPVGWIWEAGIQAETDHLDSESFETQPISIRRMVKKIKAETVHSKNISWQSNNGAEIQVLVPQSGSPLLPDPKRVRVPKLPELPKLPSLPSISVSIPKAPKISAKVPKLPARPKLPSLSSISLPSLSLPGMPEGVEIDWRRYRIVVPGLVLFGIAGFLLWPDGSENGSRERNLGPKLSVEPVANHQTKPNKDEALSDTTVQYSESLTAIEMEALTERSAKPDSIPKLRDAIASIDDPTGIKEGANISNTGALTNPTETNASQTEQPESLNDSLNSPKENIAEAVNPNQANPNKQPADTAANSSLSLAEIAQNSRDASFLGGKAAILTYFAKNMRYPKAAKRKDIKGDVVIGFEVDVEGRVINPFVIRGIGYGCDDEAKRLVANMPSWNPATVMRKRVSSKHTITVPFY
ncbi:MAG: TonB family protein [Bacteroidota bacterium]